MLLDPNNPIYQQLLKLVSDDMARFQMSALSDMRPNDQESEIGSARNRFIQLLNHAATIAFLGRREGTLNFDEIYDNDESLIVNAEKGDILTDEFQKMSVNILLEQYLQTVFKTPESHRRRRLCLIDELPIFVESCAPLLERCCTEVRKYKTSFVFCHQGANRFPDRTKNPFFLTMLDMCRTKVWFRHGIDRVFFGEQLSSMAGSKPVVKHRQVNEQQLQDGYKILNLVDQSIGDSTSDGVSNMTAETATSDAGTSVTSTLRQAAKSANEKSTTLSSSSGTSNQQSQTQQRTTTQTSSTTYKQTAVANMVTKLVSTGVQFYTPAELDRGAIDMIATLGTGEAVVFTDGEIPPFSVQTPLAENAYGHAKMYGEKKLGQFLAAQSELAMFAKPEDVISSHEEFVGYLLEELYLLPSLDAPRKNPNKVVHGSLLLPNKPKPDELGL